MNMKLNLVGLTAVFFCVQPLLGIPPIQKAGPVPLGRYIDYSRSAAVRLMDYLDRETDPALRAGAAYRLHGMFSYLAANAPLKTDAYKFLTAPQTLARIRTFLHDHDGAIRKRFIEFISTVTFYFTSEQAEVLAAAYVPELTGAFSDASAENRELALWALTQFEETAAYRSPAVEAALRKRLALERDPDILEFVEELLSS